MKLLLLLCLVVSTNILAQDGLPSQPYLYVEGKAEIEKPADIVILRFDVVARNADQTKANEEVQAKAIKILALLDEKKIAKTDTIASDLRSEPQHENEEDLPQRRGKIIGYSVTRPFSVKVRDVSVFPKLVDELIAFGGVEFSGIDAGLSDEKPMHDEIRKKALADAHERADKTLKEMGMKIDSVFGLSGELSDDSHKDFYWRGHARNCQLRPWQRTTDSRPCPIPARARRNQPERPRHLSHFTAEVELLTDASTERGGDSYTAP
jgi:uncharacterized protein YggE